MFNPFKKDDEIKKERSMTKKIFSIRDSKAGIFHQPFFKNSHGEAERDFNALVNTDNPNGMINKYPEDFDLYYLGEYDDVLGTFKSLDTPQHIVKAVLVKRDQIIGQNAQQ